MGWQEILVIAIVAIIFIKPEDMPDLMIKAGKAFKQFKSMFSSITETTARDLHNLSILEAEKDHIKSEEDGDIGGK